MKEGRIDKHKEMENQKAEELLQGGGERRQALTEK
jgi:hypothetical protein